ncbi:hypothetical protein BDB00DRAFT_927736 [Zychaea mexicana]|uniref:uncharacterized protein n=1 Tax=Zychaea mexicana TaxID=64656 RepID=UPI0022FDDAC7|nr:uncharacterized protein BDB00DRAFT_927736 [Zychaea mexicana]KAI9495042.1 hypothetical protein BDB00DRAFT_927736 [Zychaea mexicana]
MSQDASNINNNNNNTYPAGNELAHLRSQNEQLWKIIEKQRVMIQNLQKDNARLAIERDGVMDKLQQLERQAGLKKQKQRAASILISPEMLREIAEADDATAPTSSDTTTSPIDLPVPTIITTNLSPATSNTNSGSNSSSSSPVPPPRSPFRSVKPVDGSPPASPVPMDKAARRARARESMMPPPRNGLPEYDPTMRAASPPLPRMPPRHSMYYRPPTAEPEEVPTIQEPSDPLNRSAVNGAGIQQQQQQQQQHQMPLALGDVSVKVVGSNIKTNDRGKEVIAFIIAVNRKSSMDSEQHELWRVEKLYSDFLDLDTQLKTQPNPAVTSKISKLPDKALFTTHAPNKVDMRKVALEHYLQHAVSLPWDDMSDLCEFLSTNVIEHDVSSQAIGKKEGYLTKRGKNFGGWKSRYFVLNGDVINYYESKDGSQLGTIRLTNAQIGRQTNGVTPTADESNSIYRHAFLLVEQKRAGSSHLVRHILCADSDQDRDEWVEAIIQNIRFDEEPPAELAKGQNKRNKKEKPRKPSKGEVPALREPAGATAAPGAVIDNNSSVGVAISSGVGPTPSVSSDSTDSSLLSTSLPSTTGVWPPTEVGRASLDQLPQHGRNLHTPPPILVRRSSMTNLTDENQHQPLMPPQRAPSPSGRSSEDLLNSSDDVNEKKSKNKANRMTFWPKKMFGSSDATPAPKPSTSLTTDASSTSTSASSSNAPRVSTAPTGFRSFLSRTSNEASDAKRGGAPGAIAKQSEVFGPNQVFGVPLEDAVRVSQIVEGYELPSVVYRCIEYLDAKNAVMEEGLYRLSGSTTVMKALRQKFNKDGDVNLLASKEYYDVHAVAGLLKMWLRELPTSVLSRELRTDFLHVIDLLDRKDRVNELGRLVSQLPLANYTLLRALTAHLIRVVQHSDINKMTVRNVSIVFSPTLGIPAMIFNLFMSEFEYVFWTTEDGDAAPRRIEDEPASSCSSPAPPRPPPAVAVATSVDDETASCPLATQQQDDRATAPQPSLATQQAERSSEQQPPAPAAAPAPAPAQPALGRKPTLKLREEFGRSNRNSVNYLDGAPNAIVELERHMDGPPVLDEDDEDFNELSLTSAPRVSEDDTCSIKSSDISTTPHDQQQQPSPSHPTNTTNTTSTTTTTTTTFTTTS